MSSANNAAPEITLDELARLIRILGMLGSEFEPEVVVAARQAVKWVREHDTDWETLLVPPAEAGVVSVAAVPDPHEVTAREAAAYSDGVKAGMATMAAQVKAQAAMAGHAAQQNHNPYGQGAAFANMAQNAPGAGLGGFGAGPGSVGAASAQGPVRASGGSGGPYPAGSWQAVAQELLDRHAAVPGVLRSREEQFVADVLARGFPTLTAAQEDWLRDIARRNSLSW